MATLHYGTETFEIDPDYDAKTVLGWFTKGERARRSAVSVPTPSGFVHLLVQDNIPIWVDERTGVNDVVAFA